MNKLKIASINLNGIQSKNKRLKIFSILHKMNFDIFCIQETHIMYDDIKGWNREWGGKAFWSPGSNFQNGVGILINPNCEHKFIQKNSDKSGKIISICTEINSCKIQILCLYGPNKPTVRDSFYKNLNTFIISNCENIICGDFNTVENQNLDRQGGVISPIHEIGKTNLRSICAEYNLIDIFREKNPNTKDFTYENNSYNFKSRIDRFYISKIFSDSAKTEIIQNHFTDHKTITLEFNIEQKDKRGPGYWKLNTQYLQNKKYQEVMELEFIKLRQYKSLHNPADWWEFFKHIIKYVTQNFAVNFKKDERVKLKNLKTELARQENLQNFCKAKNLKIQIEELELSVFNGSLVRSREKIIDNEERPSKFFYECERKNKNKTHIQKLYKSDNTITHNQDEILRTIEAFYKKLYTKSDNCLETQAKIISQYDKKISENWHDQLISPFNDSEIKTAIFTMEDQKSPGIDGIPIEFYKTFYASLKEDLIEVINYILFQKQELTESMKKAIVSLIPKNDETENLKNWRPISLLCVDYKIISKCITNRLKPTMNEIISEEQTASVPGRTIYDNLFFTRDFIELANKKGFRNTFILSLDNEKAFDKIDRDYVFRVLEKMNYPPIFIDFIRVMYKQTISIVQNNGNFSKEIILERGLRQGCPLSQPMYCIQNDVMTEKINKNFCITGINIPGKAKPIKLCQFADDTNFISNNFLSIPHIFRVYDEYELATGCNLNKEKTKAKMIGYSKNVPNFPNKENIKINWKLEDEPLKILGIDFYNNSKVTMQKNFRTCIRNIRENIKIQQQRHLSLKGKTTIINTVLLSKLWFVANLFPIPRNIQKEIDTLIFDYMWKDYHAEPISRETLYLPKNQGGLGLLNGMRQSLALRQKYFLNIGTENFHNNWLTLARYWVASKTHNFSPQWNFLNNNKIPKNFDPYIPFYFSDTLEFTKNNLEQIRLKPPTTKNIFILIQNIATKKHVVTGQRIWQLEAKFNINWKQIWNNTFFSYCFPQQNNVLYKTLHYVLPTKRHIYTHTRHKGKLKATCSDCDAQESINHLFTECNRSKEIWAYFELTLELLTKKKIDLTELTITACCSSLDSKRKKLTITIITTILHNIWKYRNIRVKERKIHSTASIIDNISKDLKEIINIHYQKYRKQDNLPEFEKKFCIDNILCYLIDTNKIQYLF